MPNKTHKNTIFIIIFPLGNLEIKGILLERYNLQRKTHISNTNLCLLLHLDKYKYYSVDNQRYYQLDSFSYSYYSKLLFIQVEQYLNIRNIKQFLFNTSVLLNK